MGNSKKLTPNAPGSAPKQWPLDRVVQVGWIAGLVGSILNDDQRTVRVALILACAVLLLMVATPFLVALHAVLALFIN